MNDDARRSRIAFLWVGVIAPLGILILAAATIIAWMPVLPDPIATHWGTDGVDGFSPKWVYVVVTVGIGAAVVVLDAALALTAHRFPQNSSSTIGPWSSTARFLGAVNLGVAVMIAVIALAGAGIQRGLADAADAPDIGGWVALGFGLLIAAAVLGWFLQPQSPLVSAEPEPLAPSIPLGSSERVVWFGTATMARSGVIVLVVALAVLVITTVFVAASGRGEWGMLAALTVVMTLVTGTMIVFRVRVNSEGLRARSLFGWPSNHVPLDRIAQVDVVQLDPFREFGGWGWRLAVDGRRGIVLRAGEALQVTQTNGRVFVVTVDGASDAAAVLDALRIRAVDGPTRGDS